MMPRLRCVVGTYERTLYGVDIDLQELKTVTLQEDATISSNLIKNATADDGDEMFVKNASQSGKAAVLQTNSISWTPIWLVGGHAGPIKAIANNKKYLATGSTDESIKLYDMKVRKDIGQLLLPASREVACGVTDLSFTGKYLISAHESGFLMIFDIRDWSLYTAIQPVKRKKFGKNKNLLENSNDFAQKSGVIDSQIDSLAVHPQSGAFALSIGAKKLQLWNLAKGTVETSQKLNSSSLALKIVFTNDGEHFLIVFQKAIAVFDKICNQVFELSLDEINQQLQNLAKSALITGLTTAIAINSNYFCVGTNSGHVFLLDTNSQKLFESVQMHKARVKALASFQSFLCSASSDGSIGFAQMSNQRLINIGEHKMPSGVERANCITLFDAQIENVTALLERRKKRAREEDDDSTGASDIEDTSHT